MECLFIIDIECASFDLPGNNQTSVNVCILPVVEVFVVFLLQEFISRIPPPAFPGKNILFLDDVTGAKINAVKAVRAQDNPQIIGFKNSRDVQVLNSVWYNDTWGNKPATLTFSGKEN